MLCQDVTLVLITFTKAETEADLWALLQDGAKVQVSVSAHSSVCGHYCCFRLKPVTRADQITVAKVREISKMHLDNFHRLNFMSKLEKPDHF